MHSVLERLKDRKVVQWAIAYLAVAWVVIQLVDVLGDQFEWPLGVQKGITWVLVVGFVATILTAFQVLGIRVARVSRQLDVRQEAVLVVDSD